MACPSPDVTFKPVEIVQNIAAEEVPVVFDSYEFQSPLRGWLFGPHTQSYLIRVPTTIRLASLALKVDLEHGRMGIFKIANCDLKMGWGRHRKYLPTVFTEHGAIMVATL